jgi:hypothetical protein
VHSDVGGGYPDRALADITLLWMADRAAEQGLALERRGLVDPDPPDPDGMLHDSFKWPYWPLLPQHRRLADPQPPRGCIGLAPSVGARHDYSPANLRAYQRQA